MDVGRIVSTQIVSGESEAPKELITGINDGSVALLGVVKALGEYLTSTDDAVRTRGLTFLTHVLSSIDPARVNRQATQVLTNFYCDKLDDADVVPPALQALTVLAKLPTFGDGDSTQVYKAVVENVKMRSYVQSTRYLVFTLVDAIMAHHRNALKKMGADFINSYVKLVEGEKDPRNLMLLFSIGRVILIEFDISAHVEDLFDVTFCYFPITFKPPPDDPYGITADDLKKALRLCMAATPRFAPMALPLFLEKMSTALGPSMRDTLQSMAACFPVYGSIAVSERDKELWEAIKTEIYYTPDAGIEADSLAAFESFLHTLYPSASDNAAGIASDIVKECLELLNEPDKSKAMAATKVLACFIRTSPLLGSYALSQALPHLFKMFNEPSLPSHRGPILAAIASLLFAARGVYAVGAGRSQIEEMSLTPFREPLLDVLREGLRTEGLQSSGVRGAVALIEIPMFLDKREVETILEGINAILIEEEDPTLRDTAVNGLITISTISPASIENLTLPILFHALPDQAPPITATAAREHYRSIIASLTKLCVQPSLFETLVIRVTSKLELLSSPVASDDDVSMADDEERETQRECTVAYAYALLHCLLNVIKDKLAAKHMDLPKYFDKVTPRLFSLAISALRTDAGEDALFRDRRVLEISAKIIEVLTWTINEERQSRFAKDLEAAFETGVWSKLVLRASDAEGVVNIPPFQVNAPPAYQNLVVLFAAGMTALRPNTPLAIADPNKMLSLLLEWTLDVADDVLQVRAILSVLASFVNKRTQDLGDFINVRMDALWMSDITPEAIDPARRQKAILAWMFVTRGLLLRNDQVGYTYVSRVFELFTKSQDTGLAAARSFSIWSEGEKEAATAKQSHSVVRLLHKQRFFNLVLPLIIDGYKKTDKEGQTVYLVALAALISMIPTSLCISELSSLLPLLLRALSLSDPDLRANVVEALGPIVETEDASASDSIHAQSPTMIDLLLKNASSASGLQTNMRVRTAALRTLSIFPDAIRYEVLHPLKSKVVRGLSGVLDDKKRLVRKEAVDARSKWIKLGGAAS